MDCDGNNEISDEEFELYKNTSVQTIEDTNGLLLNTGVVAALILSVFYPLTFTPLEASSDSEDFFSRSALSSFKFVFFLLVLVTVSLSLVSFYCSVRYYTYLSFWLTRRESRMCFLKQVSLKGLAISTQVIIFLTMLSVPFAVVVLISPTAGLVSLIVAISTFVYCYIYFESSVGGTAYKLADEEIRRLFKSQPK